MGSAHAKAYHEIDDYDLVGLVARSSKRRTPLAKELGGIPEFDDFDIALSSCKPDVVSINTYTESHKDYACLLYTSPSPRDMRRSRMPSSA